MLKHPWVTTPSGSSRSEVSQRKNSRWPCREKEDRAIISHREEMSGVSLEEIDVCVVCVVIPFILDVRFVNVPAGVTQEEGHRGFLHLPSVVLALVFLARRIQPFLSLVEREVEFCVGHLLSLFFIFFVEEKSQFVRLERDSNSRPNVKRFRGCQLNHRADRSDDAGCITSIISGCNS